MKEKARVVSIWDWEHRKSDGTLVRAWRDRNVCTDEGIEHLLGVGFSGETQNNWRIAIFEDDYTPQESDTYGSPGFTECTAYDEVDRPSWEAGPISSKQLSNSHSRAEFTFNATKTIYGGALVSAATKGDTGSGEAIEYAASKFSSAEPVEATDVLRVTCTLTGQDV